MEAPQLQLIDKVVVFDCRCAEADPHGVHVVHARCCQRQVPMVQTVQKTVEIYGPDHRDFTVAVLLKGVRCPCCVGRAGSTVACRGGDSRDPTAAGRRENRAVPHFMAVAVGKGVFRPFYGPFSHSVHLDVECPPCRDFF